MTASRLSRAGVVAGLLALGAAVQIYFFERYPQPILFGDPAGYYQEGLRWKRALGVLFTGGGWAVVEDAVRTAPHFVGVGILFAGMEAASPYDVRFFRWVFAAFNTLGMLGAFVLARRLSGELLGGVAALALAAIHPSFATHTGRLYPDPATGCFFVWAAALFLEARHRHSLTWAAAAGASLSLALFIRPQLLPYVLGLAALALLFSAPAWCRDADARRLALGLTAGVAPVALLWAFTVTSVGGGNDLVRDNAAWGHRYPNGFWQYLETDGWEGPYRRRTEPYYQALEAAARERPELLRSRSAQLAFTAEYLAARPWPSLLLVFDNAYRLYDRPANPYRWDYPFSVEWQAVYQKLIVVLFMMALALYGARAPGMLPAFFVPAALAVIHGLAFPWPRYGFPALLTLIGGAGAALAGLVREMPALRDEGVRGRRAGGLVASVLLAWILGHSLFMLTPELARGLRLAALLVALGLPFAWVSRRTGRRFVPITAGALLLILVLAHAVRDRLWHTFDVRLGGRVRAVEQEIDVPAEDRRQLQSASEVFLVADLSVPRGDTRGLSLEVNGHRFAPGELMPTMPRLPEATRTGGRDWRGYPQWWAVPLPPALRPPVSGEPFRVKLEAADGAVTLRGDRFSAQRDWYEGPSFGNWPRVVAGKLEYDGDYRLAVRTPLGSVSTRSYEITSRGARREVTGVYRLRLISLTSNEGGLVWESPLPARKGRVAFGLAAYSGLKGTAWLRIDGVPAATFPLGSSQAYEVPAGAFRLCHRPEPPRSDKPYGLYFLIGEPPPRPLGLAVAFHSGMSDSRLYFQLDRRRDDRQVSAGLATCPSAAGATFVPAVERIVDASRNNYPEDTGRWAVAAVY